MVLQTEDQTSLNQTLPSMIISKKINHVPKNMYQQLQLIIEHWAAFHSHLSLLYDD